MASSINIDTVEDEERVYRRIPYKHYDSKNEAIDHETFKPKDYDPTGISVDRARSKQHATFKTIEEAAKSPSQNKQYYVAVFLVSDLRKAGLDVVADPLNDNPGHALIPNLNYQDRKSTEVIDWMQLLATELCLDVPGPYPKDPE